MIHQKPKYKQNYFRGVILLETDYQLAKSGTLKPKSLEIDFPRTTVIYELQLHGGLSTKRD